MGCARALTCEVPCVHTCCAASLPCQAVVCSWGLTCTPPRWVGGKEEGICVQAMLKLQAEAVAALVGARTAAAADSALAGLAGGAGAAVAGMRAAALSLLVEIEAGIDFEDEVPQVCRVALGSYQGAPRLH